MKPSRDLRLRNFAATTQRCYLSFLYRATLERPWDKHDFPRRPLDKKLPVVLSADQVEQFLSHVVGVKHRCC